MGFFLLNFTFSFFLLFLITGNGFRYLCWSLECILIPKSPHLIIFHRSFYNLLMVCEALCNLGFEKWFINRDHYYYRTKTWSRRSEEFGTCFSVRYLSLHCRLIHHRQEIVLYVSCRWRKTNSIIVKCHVFMQWVTS